MVGPGDNFGPDTKSNLESLGAKHIYTTSFGTTKTLFPPEDGVRLIHHFLHIPNRDQDPTVFKDIFSSAMKREENIFFEIPFPKPTSGRQVTMYNVPGAPKGMVEESKQYKPFQLEANVGGEAGTPSSRGGFDNAWQADLVSSDKDGNPVKVRFFESALPDPYWIRDHADLLAEYVTEWDEHGFKVVAVSRNRIALYRVIGEDDKTFEADNAAVWKDFSVLIPQGNGERSDPKWADSDVMNYLGLLSPEDRKKEIDRYQKVQAKKNAAAAEAQQKAPGILGTIRNMLSPSTPD